MKKIILSIVLLTSMAFAGDDIHLKALQDFSSTNPTENFKAELIEDGYMNGIYMLKGDIINCTLQKTKDPTRAKRDAKAYFNIVSYEDSKGVHKVAEDITGRYAKSVMNKEKLKEIKPKNVIKRTAGFVGDYFLRGVSYGISFIDGLITNNEGNRFKSGVKQVYDDSVLSYIEYGDEIDIKKGDTFYFVVNPTKEKDIGLVQDCDEENPTEETTEIKEVQKEAEEAQTETKEETIEEEVQTKEAQTETEEAIKETQEVTEEKPAEKEATSEQQTQK